MKFHLLYPSFSFEFYNNFNLNGLLIRFFKIITSKHTIKLMKQNERVLSSQFKHGETTKALNVGRSLGVNSNMEKSENSKQAVSVDKPHN